MKNKNSIFKYIKAASVCLLAITLLAACQGRKDTDTGMSTDAQTSGSDVTTSAETAANAESTLAKFEKEQLGGTFNVLCSDAFSATIYIQQAPGEAENGDIVNDQLIRRDRLIEDYFGVDITYNVIDTNAGIADVARKSMLANAADYDLIFGSMRSTIAGLATSGYLIDFYQIPNIDLDAEWWSAGVQRDLAIGGKIYFASGDITTRYMASPYVICFNEKLLEARGVESPYQLVYDGAWTMEKMSAMYKDSYSDLDQNGKSTDADFLGLDGPNDAFNAFLHGAGEHTVVISDGSPVVNTDESIYNTVSTLKNYLMTPDVKIQDVSYSASNMFIENRALFIVQAACDIQLMRNMTDDYGILPIPKVSDGQKEYYCSANPYIATGVCVPYTVADFERVGMLTEAMAAVSRYTSSEAEYENTMLLKQTRNQDSLNCLRIATESTTYDLSMIYNWAGDLLTAARDGYVSGGEYASVVARFGSMYNKQIGIIVKKMIGG